MTPPKLRRKTELNYLKCCPLCHSGDLKIKELDAQTLDDPSWDTIEIAAEIECQSCKYIFSTVASPVLEWEYNKPPELQKLEDLIRENIQLIPAYHKSDTVQKLLFANALQLLANEALEAAHSNRSSHLIAKTIKVQVPDNDDDGDDNQIHI